MKLLRWGHNHIEKQKYLLISALKIMNISLVTEEPNLQTKQKRGVQALNFCF
jgi:hypothetical protein